MATSRGNPLSELSNCADLSLSEISILSEIQILPEKESLPVNAYGDGGLIEQVTEEENDFEEKENVENVVQKVAKKKTRGTRGGRKNREKREIRESRKKEKLGIEQLSPIKFELGKAVTPDEQEKNMNTKKTYTPKMLIKIRDRCSTRLVPPMVLAPMEKAGIVIFPVEYVPVEERQGKASPDDRTLLADKIEEIICKVQEMGRKPFEGRTPYFVQKHNSMEKAKEVYAIQIDADGNLGDKGENQDREMEDDLEPSNHLNQKWPMRPPKLGTSPRETSPRDSLDESIKRPKTQRNSLTGVSEGSLASSREWDTQTLQSASGMYPYCQAPFGLTWGIQYYPVPVVYAPVYHPGSGVGFGLD